VPGHANSSSIGPNVFEFKARRPLGNMKILNHNVIVLGGHTTALYVVRSLGRIGAKVAIIDTTSLGEARFSRYCDSFTKISKFSGEEVVDAIAEIAKQLGPCAIFPTTDDAVKCLSQAIDEIEADHIAMVPPWSVANKAYDKHATYDAARSCDVPIPDTFYLDSDQDILNIAKSCTYPVLIKPTTTAFFRSVFHAKAIAAQDESDLLHKYGRIKGKVKPDEILVQEFVPGSNRHFWHYGCVFDKAAPAFSYVISRKRQYPIDFGTASHAEIADKPRVAELGSRILVSMEFTGPVEVQFKYDARIDDYMLLDVNPRFWKSCAIADLLGVNMPHIAYELHFGRREQPVQIPSDERLIWYDVLPDIVVAATDIIGGRLSFREWITSYKGRRIEATFSRDDVLPGIALTAMAPISYLRGVS
jgi:predicted ATP-grasp superfamily ATP-dependent carboligase